MTTIVKSRAAESLDAFLFRLKLLSFSPYLFIIAKWDGRRGKVNTRLQIYLNKLKCYIDSVVCDVENEALNSLNTVRGLEALPVKDELKTIRTRGCITSIDKVVGSALKKCIRARDGTFLAMNRYLLFVSDDDRRIESVKGLDDTSLRNYIQKNLNGGKNYV